MDDRSKRLSQGDVMAAITAAVEVETKRVEQITDGDVDAVAGGYGGGIGGATMGYFPPKPVSFE